RRGDEPAPDAQKLKNERDHPCLLRARARGACDLRSAATLAHQKPHPTVGRATGRMAIIFEGFPRLLDRSSLRPGRWFLAAMQKSPIICFSTDVSVDDKSVALTFRLAKPEQIEFAPSFMDEISGAITTIED